MNTEAAGEKKSAGSPVAVRKPGWKAKLGLLIFSFVFVCITGEVGLRVVGYRPPEILTAEMKRSYKMHQPGAEFVYRGYLDGMFSDFATPVKFNSLGFHDVEHAEARAKTNTFRVMVIGDSYVAALSCPLETTFFRRLEAKLNTEDPLGRGSYEVLAFGQGNQAQEKEAAYVAKFGPVYRPDVVVLLFFCGNDFMENSAETFKAAGKFATMYQRVIAKRKQDLFNRVFVLRSSRLNGLAAEGLTTFYAGHLHWFTDELKPEDLVSPELGVYRNPLDPVWQRAYDRTGELLGVLKDEVAKLGVPMVIAGLSGPQAIGDVGQAKMAAGAGGLDSLQPARWLESWCASNAVPYVALEPALAAAGKRRVFWRHDGHLNPFGNEVIVEPVSGLVLEQAQKK